MSRRERTKDTHELLELKRFKREVTRRVERILHLASRRLPSSRARRRRVVIDAVNVAPSVSPRAVIPSSSSSSSSSSSGGVDVSSFRAVLLRVLQTEQRA